MWKTTAGIKTIYIPVKYGTLAYFSAAKQNNGNKQRIVSSKIVCLQ